MKYRNARLKYGRLASITPADIAAGGGTVDTAVVDTQPDTEPTADEEGTSGEVDGDHGFPANTPIKDLTDAQKIAYYKYQSRRWEARAKKNRAQEEPAPSSAGAGPTDVDESTAGEETVDGTPAEEPTADETSTDTSHDPVEQARLDGELLGAEKYLKKTVAWAVKAELKGVLPDESIAAITDVIDPHAFLADGGDLDEQKITETFKHFSVTKPKKQRDSVDSALRHDSPGNGSQGSVKENTARIAKRLRESNTKAH